MTDDVGETCKSTDKRPSLYHRNEFNENTYCSHCPLSWHCEPSDKAVTCLTLDRNIAGREIENGDAKGRKDLSLGIRGMQKAVLSCFVDHFSMMSAKLYRYMPSFGSAVSGSYRIGKVPSVSSDEPLKGFRRLVVFLERISRFKPFLKSQSTPLSVS